MKSGEELGFARATRDIYDFEFNDEISFIKLEDETLWKPEDLIDLIKEKKKTTEN